MEYEINSNTLAIIPYQKGKSKIIELNDEYIVNLTPYQVIENSCSYYGSSLNGRIKGSKNIIGSYYKLPVIVSERNNIVFFPLKKGNCWWWINFNSVKYFEKTSNGVLVSFKNELKKNISVSYTIFNNQMLKCSRLWLVYTTR